MKRISGEDFVRAWQGSKDLSEVAQKLGKSAGAIQARAVSFRKHGVALRKFKSTRTDWNKLIALAQSLSHPKP